MIWRVGRAKVATGGVVSGDEYSHEYRMLKRITAGRASFSYGVMPTAWIVDPKDDWMIDKYARSLGVHVETEYKAGEPPQHIRAYLKSVRVTNKKEVVY
jgi:hypothetical protein